MADRYRDDRDTNYFRESYGSQDANRQRNDDRGQYGYGEAGTRSAGYGNDSDTRRGYTGYEGRDYSDRYGDRGAQGGRTVQGDGYQGRNWAERAGDEVKSWVGDDEAERKREMDRQTVGRYPGEDRGETRYGAGSRGSSYGQQGGNYGQSGGYGPTTAGAQSYGSSAYGRGDYGSARYSEGQGYGARTAPISGRTRGSYDDYSNNDYGQGRGPGAYGAPRYDQGYAARSSSYTPSSYSAYDDRNAQNRAPVTDYYPDDRGFLSKAGDEVKSWFGDEEAERRRQMDASRDDAGQAFGRSDTQSLGYTGTTAATSAASTPHDPHYAEYRKARMDEYDRDYHEYKQTKQKEFHDDFHNFRTSKMSGGMGTSTANATSSSVGAAMGVTAAATGALTGAAAQVREHMVVDGSDGQGVGKVDHVTGTDIKLTKHDSIDNKHHLIPLAWIASVTGNKVMLNKTSDEAMKQWRVADEAPKTQV